LKEVQGSIGWEIRIGPEVNETPFPTGEELGILRTELDPKGLYR